MMLMNINSKMPVEKDAKAQADMGKTNAKEPNVTMVTSKKPRLPDPIIGKYNDEGLFGAKPGFVKGERGKEITLDDALAEAEQEAALQAKLEKVETDRKNARMQEKLHSKAQKLIDSRENGVTGFRHGVTQLAKGLATSIAITSTAVATTFYFQPDNVLTHGAAWFGGFATIIISLVLLATYARMKAESARVRVLKSIRDNQPASEKDLKKALTFESRKYTKVQDSVQSTKSDFISDLIELERFPSAVEAIKFTERWLHMKFGYFEGEEKEDDADE